MRGANPFREGDATLTFLRGSHLGHEALAAPFPQQLETAAHWNQLTQAMIRAVGKAPILPPLADPLIASNIMHGVMLQGTENLMHRRKTNT